MRMATFRSSFRLPEHDTSASEHPLTAVIRVVPWNNGITFRWGSMAETLANLWDSMGYDRSGIDWSLVVVSDSLCSTTYCVCLSPEESGAKP